MPRRVAGAAIDLVIVVAIAGVLSARLEGMTAGITRVRIDDESGQRTIDASVSLPLWLPLVILVVVSAVYTIPLMAIWGRTVGGMLVGIRCVRADTGARPGWDSSVRRWLALYGVAGILGLTPIIGPFAWLLTLLVGLSPLWDGSRSLRGYADHFGGDIVIDAPRPGWPFHR